MIRVFKGEDLRCVEGCERPLCNPMVTCLVPKAVREAQIVVGASEDDLQDRLDEMDEEREEWIEGVTRG